jgi:hypothetical protein
MIWKRKKKESEFDRRQRRQDEFIADYRQTMHEWIEKWYGKDSRPYEKEISMEGRMR